MAQAFRYGLMELSTKENGNSIKLTVKGNSGMQMVMFMKVTGKMIRPMDTECTFTLTEPDMKDNGKMISKTDKELSLGQMAANTKEAIKKV